VLFGKKEKNENTSGDRKTTVYKRIAQVLLPEHFAIDPSKSGDRVKSKIEYLRKQYIQHAKKLQCTGGGIGHESDDETSVDEGTDVIMDFYIPPDGPDNLTTPEVRNLWEQIEAKFQFFPSRSMRLGPVSFRLL